jgi:hypothetical protein
MYFKFSNESQTKKTLSFFVSAIFLFLKSAAHGVCAALKIQNIRQLMYVMKLTVFLLNPRNRVPGFTVGTHAMFVTFCQNYNFVYLLGGKNGIVFTHFLAN